MDAAIALLIKQARETREAGSLERAHFLYQQVADLCASNQYLADRAFALRHMSDLSRELGRFEDALATAREAEAIYRVGLGKLGNELDRANCLRLVALAHLNLDDERSAIPFWHEAMHIYAQAGVAAGVAECEHHLGL